MSKENTAVTFTPTLSDIEECKLIANGMPIYKYQHPNILDQSYLIRPITYKEWKFIIDQRIEGEPSYLENERVAKVGILYPSPKLIYDSNNFGRQLDSIVSFIYQVSGLFEFKDPLLGITEILSDQSSEPPPTSSIIEIWKNKSPGNNLRLLEFPSLRLIIRSLSFQEYQAILNIREDFIEEIISGCKVATLWPSNINWEIQPAGIIETVYDNILKISLIQVEPIIKRL